MPTDRAARPNESAQILVVEDDEDLCTVLAELLSDVGFRVATARHGRDALDYLASNPSPQVIMLDLMMPVMDGEEFLRARARDASLARIPVFLFSARGEAPERLAALGVARVFRKPLEVSALLTALQTVLGR